MGIIKPPHKRRSCKRYAIIFFIDPADPKEPGIHKKLARVGQLLPFDYSSSAVGISPDPVGGQLLQTHDQGASQGGDRAADDVLPIYSAGCVAVHPDAILPDFYVYHSQSPFCMKKPPPYGWWF